jgi:quercetin dioxygenase-like cupin family protein
MQIKNISQASDFNPEKYVAEEFLEGTESNVRIIKLAPGTTLPPHKHGTSDLMLYVAAGTAQLETENGPVEFSFGDLAFISHEEELRVSNQKTDGVILLAFLTPKFPSRN